jgi:hypothetical protein
MLQAAITGKLFSERENDCSAGVPDVPLSSLHVIRRRRLDQWIPFGNPAVLGFPHFRAPAAASDASG